MAEVKLEKLCKSFGKERAVIDMDMSIENGGFVVLLGPSGAGKTTTLRLIAGLEKIDSGVVKIDGRVVNDETPVQRDVAMVFQQYSLYPHMSVRNNLAFPLRSPVFDFSEDEIARQVGEVAEILKITDKLDNRATELSGGEMQRVSIGRALVRNPAIFLMDEPLSSLDARLRAELRIELKRIQSDLGATLLYVTHDQIEAMTMATKIGVLQDGALAQCGAPREIYDNPNSVYVAGRLGLPRINILPSDLFPTTTGRADRIGLRPEHIAYGAGQEAAVKRVEQLGDQTRLHLELNGHAITALSPEGNPYSAGSTVKIQPVNPLCFDENGDRITGRNL